MNTAFRAKTVPSGLCGRWVLYSVPADLVLTALDAYATGNNGNDTILHVLTSLMTIALSTINGALILRYLLSRRAPFDRTCQQ